MVAHLDRGASVVNLPKDFKGTPEELAELSPGDSGVHLVDLDNGFSIASYGGYGAFGTPGREGGAADRFVSGILKPLGENEASHTLTFEQNDGRILLRADGGIVSMSMDEARRAADELTRLTKAQADGSGAKFPGRFARVWNRLRHRQP